MSATVEERTGALVELLREYAGKLLDLNRELQQSIAEGRGITDKPGRVAWLLDRAKRFTSPIRDLVNQGTHLVGVNAFAEEQSVEAIELALRVGETEAQLHHVLRQFDELQKLVENLKLTDHVARLRESAGLNAMKGGPLRPKS